MLHEHEAKLFSSISAQAKPKKPVEARPRKSVEVKPKKLVEARLRKSIKVIPMKPKAKKNKQKVCGRGADGGELILRPLVH